jgi:hypothetical protein
MKKTASTPSSAPAVPAVARAAGGLPKVTKAGPVVPKKAAPPPAAAKVLPPRPDPVSVDDMKAELMHCVQVLCSYVTWFAAVG